MSEEKLTKAEIITNIANRLDLNKKDVHKVLYGLFDELKTALQEDMTVELRGFGTFEIRTRKGRDKARNPKTGEVVPVKAHGVAIFRPGKELKTLVWNLRS